MSGTLPCSSFATWCLHTPCLCAWRFPQCQTAPYLCAGSLSAKRACRHLPPSLDPYAHPLTTTALVPEPTVPPFSIHPLPLTPGTPLAPH